MRSVVKKAFSDTIPVLTGYLVLGFGFGIIMKSSGLSLLCAVAMSVFIYAGSMQYVAVSLFTGGASLITVALTTLMVNARHLFYGVSMLEKYRGTGKIKPYLIFALTDETYSLLIGDDTGVPEEKRRSYYLLVSVFNHFYWVLGTFVGALGGTVLHFNSSGIDFALTALFITIFVEQWLTSKSHASALIGVGASVLCLVIFGADSFLVPAMALIALCLCLLSREVTVNE